MVEKQFQINILKYITKSSYSLRRINYNRELIPDWWHSHTQSMFANTKPRLGRKSLEMDDLRVLEMLENCSRLTVTDILFHLQEWCRFRRRPMRRAAWSVESVLDVARRSQTATCWRRWNSIGTRTASSVAAAIVASVRSARPSSPRRICCCVVGTTSGETWVLCRIRFFPAQNVVVNTHLQSVYLLQWLVYIFLRLLHFLPIQWYFYPSKTGFTC